MKTSADKMQLIWDFVFTYVKSRFSHDVAHLYSSRILKVHLSRVVRKPAYFLCKNKDADQLPSNREADQCLCFNYIDSTVPLLPKYEISSL